MKPDILNPKEKKLIGQFTKQLSLYLKQKTPTFKKVIIEHKTSPIITTISLEFVFYDKKDPEFVDTHFILDVSDREIKDIYYIIKQILKSVGLNKPEKIEHRIQPYFEEKVRLYYRNREVEQGSLIPLQLNNNKKIFIVDLNSSTKRLFFWFHKEDGKYDFSFSMKSAPFDKLNHLHSKIY